MRIYPFALSALLCAAPVFADGSAGNGAKLSADDLSIIAHEHAVNSMEITAGQLAMKNSSTKSVQDYGQELVNDHQKADGDLLAFARQHDAVVAKDVPTTDAARKAQSDDMAAMAQLKTMKGPSFDAKFLTTMAAGHARELDTLDGFVSRTNEAELKALLAGVRPVMVTHEETAKSLEQATPRT